MIIIQAFVTIDPSQRIQISPEIKNQESRIKDEGLRIKNSTKIKKSSEKRPICGDLPRISRYSAETRNPVPNPSHKPRPDPSHKRNPNGHLPVYSWFSAERVTHVEPAHHPPYQLGLGLLIGPTPAQPTLYPPA